MAKKPRRQPEEEGESAGPPFRQWCRQFFTRLAASPLSLSVSHLLGNSLASPTPPPPTLYRPHRQPVGLPSLRASQSGRQDAEQSKQTLAAARPTMGGGINGQKLSAAPVASKTHSKPKTRCGAY